MAAVSLQLNMPIQSASVINEQADASPIQTPQTAEVQMQSPQQVDTLCHALQQAAEKLERCTEELFLSHKEQIVRLSVEIASKILAKERGEQDYDIEKILTQALQTVPASKQITVRLNPDDLQTVRNMSQSDQLTLPEGVHFAGDASIGPAECIIETDHGVIEYLIEEHLRQVASALLQTNNNTVVQAK
jgi:flagellar biosynthesis/type III secretory pathway protein FliH